MSTVTAINDMDDFAALDPFVRIAEEGLSGFVDGDRCFDLPIAVFEAVGWPEAA